MILQKTLKSLPTMTDEQLLYLRGAIMFEFQRRRPYPTKTPIALYWENLFREESDVSSSNSDPQSPAA